MPNRKSTHDISPKIRAATFRAIARLGGDEKLASMIEESFKTDFLGTLNTLARFSVRENTNTVEVGDSLLSILQKTNQDIPELKQIENVSRIQ